MTSFFRAENKGRVSDEARPLFVQLLTMESPFAYGGMEAANHLLQAGGG